VKQSLVMSVMMLVNRSEKSLIKAIYYGNVYKTYSIVYVEKYNDKLIINNNIIILYSFYRFNINVNQIVKTYDYIYIIKTL
jgi:hypothetical protein